MRWILKRVGRWHELHIAPGFFFYLDLLENAVRLLTKAQTSSPWKPDLSPDVEKCNFFFNPFCRRTQIKTASLGFVNLKYSLTKKIV